MEYIDYEKIYKDNLNYLVNTDNNLDDIITIYNELPYISISISPKIGYIDDMYNINDEIILITQFYIHEYNVRNKEIKDTLDKNIKNKLIDKIYLLNECIYTDEQLYENKLYTDEEKNKLIQINIKNRLKYKDIYNIIDEYNISGYIIIANNDIFFDETLLNIKKVDLINKNVLCLCRYEYNNEVNLNECKLYDSGRPDSQDTWIFHTNNNIEKRYRDIFNFELGKLGCDNKIIYLYSILGYICYNQPNIIKTYHNHSSKIRNINIKNVMNKPLFALYPYIENSNDNITYNIIIENNRLKEYIKNKIIKNEKFIIPRVGGIDIIITYIGILIKNDKININDNIIDNLLNILKNNSGIKITNRENIVKYSEYYLQSFDICDLYLDWLPFSNVGVYIIEPLLFIHKNFKKKRIDALTLDIYNHIHNNPHNNPWIQELKNKRILIISPFINSIKKQLNIRDKIYGIELFPNCKFIFIKPPQTHGTNISEEFDIELLKLLTNIKNIENDFDIALLSCGGYGNIVCSYIYNIGKSAIYIGGVLQMYFGIYGKRWEIETPEILKIYKNEYWIKPDENERPINFKNIENGCYW
jgi:hypothetical protein